MPEEMRFLLRAGAYGIGIAVVYYVLTAEPAGTILMLGFGIAAVVLLGVIWWERRRAGSRLEGPVWRWPLLPPATEDGGLTHELARLPGSSLAPLTLGFGIALAALALVFGPWLLAAAVVPLVVGARDWLGQAMAEHAAIDELAADRDAPSPAAGQGGPPPVVNRR